MKQTQRVDRSGPVRPSSRRPMFRRTAVLLSGLTLLATAACGFNAQTLQPYTPSEGVNTDVGVGADGKPTDSTVLVRGLMVITRAPGSGFLSGSLETADSDALTKVSGYVVRADGSQGSALAIPLRDPIAFGNNTLVVLTDRTEVPVTGPDLTAGGTVLLTLTFSKAGSKQITATVVDGNLPNYQTVSPSPLPSASASG